MNKSKCINIFSYGKDIILKKKPKMDIKKVTDYYYLCSFLYYIRSLHLYIKSVSIYKHKIRPIRVRYKQSKIPHPSFMSNFLCLRIYDRIYYVEWMRVSVCHKSA